MKVNLNEIKEALSKARTPYVKSEETGDLLDNTGETVADFIYHEEDAHLIANAPEWLASLVSEAERWEKEARLQYRLFNEEIDKSRELRNQLVTSKDVERELIKICDNYKRQVEEMQKTLEWYANKEHYHSKPTEADFTEWDAPEANEDGGERARQTLQSLKGEPHDPS